MITTRIVMQSDKIYLNEHYRHISAKMFEHKFTAKDYMVIADNKKLFGWLRWGYFWDNTPMMNMLYIEIDYRSQGYGKQLVIAWEDIML